MAGDASNIFIAQDARLYLAAVGSAAPVDLLTPMAAPWRDVGLFTPDSLSWSTDPSFEEVRSHQSRYATRRFQTEDAASAEVDLQEWKGENFQAVYGGGTITEISASGATNKVYKFVPPGIGGRTTIAATIELMDGTKKVRRVIPRCEQGEGVEQSLGNDSESTLPLRLNVLGTDIGDPWYDLNNLPWATALSV